MPELARVLLLPGLLALGGFALTGCAGHDRRAPLQLKTLTERLPGTYDNAAQVAQEVARGAANPHLALTLRVAPAHAITVSDNLYYVRETIAADPRRVLSQRLWTLSEDPKHGRILQSLYVFKDPLRWARAAEDPEMLVALTPDDLEPLQGCELAWTETDGLLRAVAAGEHCRPEALKEGMLLEQRMTLHGDELSLGEAEVGADGKVAAPALFDADVDFYRFVRRSSVAPSESATAH